MAQFFYFFRKSKAHKEIVENERRYPRKEAHELMTIQFPYAIQGEYPLVDISEGGIRFTCPDKLLNPGDLFTCSIHLAAVDIQISVMAKVVWAESFENRRDNRRGMSPNFYHVGASLLSIHEEACAVIRNFVKSPLAMSS